MTPFQHRLLHGPILATLMAFATPNLVAFCSGTVAIAETAYVGRIGVFALAGITIVFPVMMLMQTLSGGAFGAAVSGVISRALGAGNQTLAEDLARAAWAISLLLGITFAILLGLGGPVLFRGLGAADETLKAAITYGSVAAFALPGIWVTSIMSAVMRGSGHMTFPAAVLLLSGVLQVILGAVFAFGIGPVPGLGIAGIALGTALATTTSAIAVTAFMLSARSNLRFTADLRNISWASMRLLLHPSLLAALSPIQTVATVIATTALVSRFGAEALAGFGIGARLEFLLIPIAFSIGVASIPLVGAAIGAGEIARARRVAWTATALAGTLLALVGAVMAVFPDISARIFAHEGPTLDAARSYLTNVSYAFGFFGVALCLYFASQGAGKIIGPILAQSLRLAIMVIGGWFIVQQNAALDSIFLLAALAMAAQGLAAAAAVKLMRW